MTIVLAFLAILVGGVALFVIGAPIAASLTYCAPKWWHVRVRPHIRRTSDAVRSKAPDPWLLDELGYVLTRDLGGPSLFAWVGKVLRAIVGGIIVSVEWYVKACESFVQRRCPYEYPWETRYQEWKKTVVIHDVKPRKRRTTRKPLP